MCEKCRIHPLQRFCAWDGSLMPHPEVLQVIIAPSADPVKNVTFTLPKPGQGNTYTFTRLPAAEPVEWSLEYIVPGYTPNVPEALPPAKPVAAMSSSTEPFRFIPISERSCAGSERVAGSPTEARRMLIRTHVRWPKCPRHGHELIIEGIGSTPYTESLIRCPDCYVYDPPNYSGY